jgi:hypothetical protein
LLTLEKFWLHEITSIKVKTYLGFKIDKHLNVKGLGFMYILFFPIYEIPYSNGICVEFLLCLKSSRFQIPIILDCNVQIH